jgi:hypothetical protein
MDDWQWFRANRDRRYRCRLATAAEIADIKAHDALPAEIGRGEHFIYAFVRHAGLSMQIIFAVYLPLPEPVEAQCMVA